MIVQSIVVPAARLLVRVIAGIVETVVSVRAGLGVTSANAGVAVKASAAALSSNAIVVVEISSGRDPASRTVLLVCGSLV